MPDTQIRKLVYEYGGPAKARRRLRKRGVDIPEVTMISWTSRGKLKRKPPAWVYSLLARALK